MKTYPTKLQHFLAMELAHVGWRFWLLFVIATNLGFFAGLGVEYLIFGAVNVYVGMILSGVGQSWVLSRHFPERGEWGDCICRWLARRWVVEQSRARSTHP